ncbi:hypothetical protein HO614_09520 [Streptococcus suis]|nr:hypothetical protein [Streptococcus suis]
MSVGHVHLLSILSWGILVYQKKKKQALVLEYSLVLEPSISDQVLTETIVNAQPLNFIVNKQAPKKKYL